MKPSSNSWLRGDQKKRRHQGTCVTFHVHHADMIGRKLSLFGSVGAVVRIPRVIRVIPVACGVRIGSGVAIICGAWVRLRQRRTRWLGRCGHRLPHRRRRMDHVTGRCQNGAGYRMSRGAMRCGSRNVRLRVIARRSLVRKRLEPKPRRQGCCGLRFRSRRPGARRRGMRSRIGCYSPRCRRRRDRWRGRRGGCRCSRRCGCLGLLNARRSPLRVQLLQTVIGAGRRRADAKQNTDVPHQNRANGRHAHRPP
jgi:hypothetical protein